MQLKLSLNALVLSAAVSFTANAIELKPIAGGRDTSVVSPDQPIACDQVVNALADLQQKISSHENSLTAFLGQVSQGLRDWYTQLKPLEATSQTIPAGTFSVLQDAADKTDVITNDAFDNTDYVTTQLARIVSAARACSITAPALPSRK